MKMYYLMPTVEQNQKSFYGKAVIAIDDNGTETLFSYNTKIISKKTERRTCKVLGRLDGYNGKAH